MGVWIKLFIINNMAERVDSIGPFRIKCLQTRNLLRTYPLPSALRTFHTFLIIHTYHSHLPRFEDFGMDGTGAILTGTQRFRAAIPSVLLIHLLE